MTALPDHAADDLQLRRTLGHKLADAHRLLPRFAAYLEAGITMLMAQARHAIPTPLRAATVETLIGLLAATGLFSRGHRPWCKSGLRVCAAQRLMERR